MLTLIKKISFLMIILMPVLAHADNSDVSFREGGGNRGGDRGNFNRGAEDRNFNRGAYNHGNENIHRDNFYGNPNNSGSGTTVIVPGQTDYQYENQLYNQNQPNPY